MSDIPPIALPAPIFRRTDGSLDLATNARYAEHIAGTWIEHVVVAGPMGAGEFCTADQRAAVVDLWAQHHPPEHLIVACWERREVERALGQGMRALMMMRCETDDDLFDALAALSTEAIAYTNPRYSRAVLTPAAISEARRRGALPSTVKFSKVTLAELVQFRTAGGADLRIMMGRHGTSPVAWPQASTSWCPRPLAALPQRWPEPTLDAVQHAADELQQTLDAQAGHQGRVAIIAELAGAMLAYSR